MIHWKSHGYSRKHLITVNICSEGHLKGSSCIFTNEGLRSRLLTPGHDIGQELDKWKWDPVPTWSSKTTTAMEEQNWVNSCARFDSSDLPLYILLLTENAKRKGSSNMYLHMYAHQCVYVISLMSYILFGQIKLTAIANKPPKFSALTQ